MSFFFGKATELRRLAHKVAITLTEARSVVTRPAAQYPRIKPAHVAIPETLAFPTVFVSTPFSTSAEGPARIELGETMVARRGVKTV